MTKSVCFCPLMPGQTYPNYSAIGVLKMRKLDGPVILLDLSVTPGSITSSQSMSLVSFEEPVRSASCTSSLISDSLVFLGSDEKKLANSYCT
mmetsp:Transcript_10779/g.12649  ORF Transcript_10779/g.12649 Transcript_10779/m.12649 type:complete len:92 (-) Transcript_10779:2739-3014(-)